MNIVVCLKWLISADNIIRVENGAINDRGLCRVVNPYDLIAVEEAIRLKELHTEGEVTLVCLGPASAERGLRRCLAMGADKSLIINDADFENLDSYATALILAEAIRHLNYDLILCGQKTADMEGGQVGTILSEVLNLPVVSAATKIDITAGRDKLIIHRKMLRGNREVVETSLPALITVESGFNKPRYPNLRAVFAAREKEIIAYTHKTLTPAPEQLKLNGCQTRIMAHSTPRPKPKKPFTPDSSLPAAERMRLIMSGGVTQKQGNLLEGNSDYLATNLVRFLSEQKLLPYM